MQATKVYDTATRKKKRRKNTNEKKNTAMDNDALVQKTRE
jgi:hypothetical protein